MPRLAIASGILHVGQALGGIVPATFFVSSYRTHWIARGVSPAEMDGYIRFSKGLMGLSATVVVFALAFVGMCLGQLILRRHLANMQG